MIVFAARLMGTLFGRQIVLSVHKLHKKGRKMKKERKKKLR